PMLASRFLRSPHAKKHGWLYNAFESIFDFWLRVYDVTLSGALRFRFVTFLVSAALLGGTLYLFGITPKGFQPSADAPVRIMAHTEAAQGISFDDMSAYQDQVSRILQAYPYVRDVGAILNSGNRGTVVIHPRPKSEGTPPADKIIADLRPNL